MLIAVVITFGVLYTWMIYHSIKSETKFRKRIKRWKEEEEKITRRIRK